MSATSPERMRPLRHSPDAGATLAGKGVGMKMTGLTRTYVALMLVAISVSGCSNGGTGDGTVAPGVTTVATTAGSPSAEPQSPLTVYLNSLYGLSGSPDEQQQQRAAKEVKKEALIGTCMKDAGFDYIPVPPAETTTGLVGPSEQDLDSRDWVAAYGYGLIETEKGKTSDLYATKDKKGGGKSTKGDPNHAYVASLTTSEKAAYDRAMYGQDMDPGADKMNQTDDWRKMGCFGSAQHEAGVGQDPLDSAEGKSVNATIQDFENGWTTWPGMPQLQAAWVTCMGGKGYAGYKQQSDAATEIGTQIAAAQDDNGAWKPSADVSTLAAKERKLALADLDCRVETNFRSTYQSISDTAETKFMKDNAAALDALKSSMEQGR